MLLVFTEVYKALEKAISHRPEFRYKAMPKDAFHVACAGHKARIQNILKSPGINLAEKELLKQRYSNMGTAQSVYWTCSGTRLVPSQVLHFSD